MLVLKGSRLSKPWKVQKFIYRLFLLFCLEETNVVERIEDHLPYSQIFGSIAVQYFVFMLL